MMKKIHTLNFLNKRKRPERFILPTNFNFMFNEKYKYVNETHALLHIK